MKAAGYVAVFTVSRIYGWAWDPDRPDEPIDIELVHRGEVLLTTRADQFRSDLACSGFGNGRHGFELLDLDHLVPTMRCNVSVRRAFDSEPLLGAPGELVPTAAPHLLILPGIDRWYLAFGPGRYDVTKQADAERLATLLPLSIAESNDDVLPELGAAGLAEDESGFVLLLQPNEGAQALHIPISEPDRDIPLLRWCQGRPSHLSWVGTEVSLEVENTLGIELNCYLGDHVHKEPKPLDVCTPEAQQRFMLNRGAQTTISFRVPQAARHRISITTCPEPDSRDDLGFQLLRLRLLGRSQPGAPSHDEQ